MALTRVHTRMIEDDPISIKDFGAVGDGIADDTTAIQSALNSEKSVYFPAGIYLISSTLKLTSDGQILYGEGTGNTSEPAQTQLKWNGSSGGTMLSISDGSTENYQNCTIRDIYFNGNSLANIGIEAYSSSVSGGAWRNRYINLTISNLTGANSTGIDLGSGSFPDFAHDTEITGCFIIGAVRGLYGAGATHRVLNTTFSLCTNAVVALAGSSFLFNSSVFSQSTQYDFSGSNITNAAFTGCWFEDSGTGIYLAATSHSVSFIGCQLQTSAANTTKLMDWGNAAGYAIVKGCVVGSTSGSTLIKNINANLEYDITGSNCTIDSGYRIRGQGVSRFDQASFAAGLTSDASNVTGDGTAYSINTVAWTEEYDSSSLFNASTGVFTSGIYGLFQFDAQVALGGLAAGHTDAQLFLVVDGNDYLLSRVNAGAAMTGSNELVMSGTKTVSVEPSDTVYLKLTISGSTKVVDILSGGSVNLFRTRFEGRLI